MTVLVTGAAGRIGTHLRRSLPAFGWTVRGFDRTPVDDEPARDITKPADLDRAVDEHTTAIVHLAAQSIEAPWSTIRETNIEGVFQVFEAARRNGIERVVFASSIHAVGFTHIEPDLPADTPLRPDTLYGVSKAFGEAVARYYVDRYGLRVACLRIGAFQPSPVRADLMPIWLSPGDCTRLVDACLRAPDLTFAQVWGVSANSTRWMSLAAGRALGYEPVDDSSMQAVAETGLTPRTLVGERFTDAYYGIDEVAARAEGGASDS